MHFRDGYLDMVIAKDDQNPRVIPCRWHISFPLPANPCVVEEREIILVLCKKNPAVASGDDEMLVIIGRIHANLRRVASLMTKHSQSIGNAPEQTSIDVQPRHQRL